MWSSERGEGEKKKPLDFLAIMVQKQAKIFCSGYGHFHFMALMTLGSAAAIWTSSAVVDFTAEQVTFTAGK